MMRDVTVFPDLPEEFGVHEEAWVSRERYRGDLIDRPSLRP
jgi:hypothetical protein